MSKTWVIFLIVGVVLVMLFLMTAVAAFVFLPDMQVLITQPKGPVLVYEVDPTGVPPGQSVDMGNLLRALNGRVDSGPRRLARVRLSDDGRIAVAVMGESKADKQRVERLLACEGNLQFRILANRHDNKDVIEHALANPSKAKLRDDKGNLEAWWVPAKATQEKGLVNSPEIAVRTKSKAGSKTTEILVLNDDYNITGAFLTRATASADQEGRPCITFAFNSAGGQLFGQLTSSHLPDKLTGAAYKLAIILDNEVYSAPSIQSTIYESGQITGSFTDEEVQDIVNVLNAGNLPARVRPVKK